jgi:hypothetical protein
LRRVTNGSAPPPPWKNGCAAGWGRITGSGCAVGWGRLTGSGCAAGWSRLTGSGCAAGWGRITGSGGAVGWGRLTGPRWGQGRGFGCCRMFGTGSAIRLSSAKRTQNSSSNSSRLLKRGSIAPASLLFTSCAHKLRPRQPPACPHPHAGRIRRKQ